MNPTYVSFGVYLALLLGVGFYFFDKNSNVKKYLMGSRGIGSWVSAMSAQASDMSGWLLMGLPGAIYIGGLSEAWIAIGLAAGTYLNWKFVAPRLRIHTGLVDSVTLSEYFARRFGDKTGMLRMTTASITLFFFAIYTASGLNASGKLFQSMFGIDYRVALLIGAGVILFYTLMGGYLAVCWTDFFQGLLMFGALVAVPAMAIFYSHDVQPLAAICSERGISLSLFPNGLSLMGILGIISVAAWGLGYFGQPHILFRFMTIESFKKVRAARLIAMIWVVISLSAAVAIGLAAIPLFEGLSKTESEKVFIMMIGKFFNPWLGGVLLAAILSAIMSTIDSQLMVCSSTLSEDFYRNLLRRKASSNELIRVNRLFVGVVMIFAIIFALNENETIFSLVKFAWGGFGAAFGPVVLASIYSRRTSWQAALCGMAAGTAVMIAWYASGMSTYMYEIVPGFIANFLVMWIVNRAVPQDNLKVLRRFDKMVAIRKGDIPEPGQFAKKTDDKQLISSKENI